MRRKAWRHDGAGTEQGRVLARVLAEDLRQVRGLAESPPQETYAVTTAPPPGWDVSDGVSDTDNNL